MRDAHFRHKMKLWLLAGLMALPLAFPASANDDPYILKCPSPTPAVKSDEYPGKEKIVLSNNLARPTGKASDAAGQILFLSGRVTDENCVPLIGALVDIWQTDPQGKYRTATREELLNPYPLFAGSGRATTDNMGRYSFTTLFPGPYGKNAPHIHVRVYHPDFKPLLTTIYFAGDRRNEADPKLQALGNGKRRGLQAETAMRDAANPQAGVDALFNVTLKGSSTYRGY